MGTGKESKQGAIVGHSFKSKLETPAQEARH